MPAVVTPRGQITVDRELRERLGVRPGMIAVQHVVGSQLIVTFIPAPHDRSLAGVLGRPPRQHPASQDEIEEVVERAIAADRCADG
jgi:bifunctional DNA-binding transcriptional regulator/antitoxin component of YhaV-PrlF toxin-antitoxin module